VRRKDKENKGFGKGDILLSLLPEKTIIEMKMDRVKEYYDTHVAFEDRRLDENVFELPVTFSYIDRYVHTGDRVLDVACGTGKYAMRLLERGVLLGLNDLSDKNMELTLERVGNDPRILHAGVSDALYSDIWEREPWDAILILGPLYHMTDRSDRIRLLERARSAVKKGGYLFLGFMSRAAGLLYGVKNNPAGILKDFGALQFWYTGTDDEFIEATKWFVNAYFSFPEEIEPLVREAGLEPVHLAGIEGIFGENMHLFHGMEDHLKPEWMNFIIEHCEDIHMVHCSKHHLSVCRRMT
jgi:S-adenosylmethionine-dependent methyltransferase